MNQPSCPTKAGSVKHLVDVDQNEQSDSCYSHDAGSSGTELPRAYLLHCDKVILQLSQFGMRCLIEKVLWIFQTEEPFYFLKFFEYS